MLMVIKVLNWNLNYLSEIIKPPTTSNNSQALGLAFMNIVKVLVRCELSCFLRLFFPKHIYTWLI